MSAFANLKLVAAKRHQSLAPVVQRRNKLSNQLFEQIALAKSFVEGTQYAPTRMRIVKDKETGERKTVESIKRVKAWWFTAENGRVCLQVRYGTKVLELAKGKNSIEVGSDAELVAVLETVKKCVEAGELDAQIDAASASVRARFSSRIK